MEPKYSNNSYLDDGEEEEGEEKEEREEKLEGENGSIYHIPECISQIRP